MHCMLQISNGRRHACFSFSDYSSFFPPFCRRIMPSASLPYLSFHSSGHLSVCPSQCPHQRLPLPLYFYPFVYLSFSHSVHLSLRSPDYLLICPPVPPSLPLYLYLPTYLSAFTCNPRVHQTCLILRATKHPQ